MLDQSVFERWTMAEQSFMLQCLNLVLSINVSSTSLVLVVYN